MITYYSKLGISIPINMGQMKSSPTIIISKTFGNCDYQSSQKQIMDLQDVVLAGSII